MEQGLELREYWAIFRRWWWLFVLCTLLAGGAAFVASNLMEPTYEASTLLMIGGSLEVSDPTTGEIRASEQLAQTYAKLVDTRPVMKTTMDSLGLTEEPEVSVSILRDTQLMRLTVEDSDPERAAATANELARQVVRQSPSGPEREEQAYRAFVSDQLKELEEEIAALSRDIREAQDEGDEARVARLQEELNVRRDNYSSLLDYMKESLVNYIRVFEPAQVPEEPAGPRVLQNTLLAAVVGFMLAGGAAFLIEYLDDSIKDERDVEHVLGLPALGTITQIPSQNGLFPEVVSLKRPDSPFAEAYRILYTNLRYSLPTDDGTRIFLITSPGPGEGKTTTASNIATVAAWAGQETILVEADMRRPKVHKIWDLSPTIGLADFLAGEVSSLDLQSTDVEGLSVLPAGASPPNSAELLGSPRMGDLLEELCQRAQVIVLDSPPLFAVADAGILASLAAGVVLVVESGQTKLQACARAAERVEKVGGKVLGVVLNRLDVKRGGYGYGYYGYGYYGDRDDGGE